MLLQVPCHRWTDDIDFFMIRARPVERCPGKFGGQSAAAEGLGNLAVDQSEDISGQSVFEVGHLAIALQFKAAGGYKLRGLMAAEELHAGNYTAGS